MARSLKPKKKPFLIATVSLVCATLLAAGLLWASQTQWSLQSLNPLRTNVMAAPVFKAHDDISRETARSRYRQSLKALADTQFRLAAEGFEALLPVYPRLEPLLRLHAAEAGAGLGNEAKVQHHLQRLLTLRTSNTLLAQAHYRLGQSFMRSHQPDEALEAFETLLGRYPNTEFATGGLYYWGQLLINDQAHPDNTPRALDLWRQYLDKSPDGRFAAEIARQMTAHLSKTPDRDDHRRLGIALATSGDADGAQVAIDHLRQAEFKQVWRVLGKTLLTTKQTEAGIAVLRKGLPLSHTSEDAQAGIDLIVRGLPAAKATATLNALRPWAIRATSANPSTATPGGDYLLWRLAQLNPRQAPRNYDDILRLYPKGITRPQSSWLRLFRHVPAGRYTAFMTESRRHMERFSHARSAALCCSGQGKVLERQAQPVDAKAAYETLLKRYPISYYAFRADGRLKALDPNTEDPRWQVLDAHRAYPPPLDAMRISVVDAVLDLDPALAEAARELEHIEAPDDMRTLLLAYRDKLPPIIESWIRQQSGDTAGSIRVVRDALNTRTRQGDLGGFAPTPAEMQRLYPVMFAGPIAKAARQNGLDPLLVQSLMREESYFNPLAVSGSNAMGLMQLLPPRPKRSQAGSATKRFQSLQLFEPETNIQLGSRYLNYLATRFKGNGMLTVGSYNGGPNAMDRWRTQRPVFKQDPDLFVETLPYEQTRDYIKKVYASFWNYRRFYTSESPRNTSS